MAALLRSPTSVAALPRGATAWGLAAVVLLVDQITKLLVVRELALGESTPVLGPVMSFTRRANTGGAFSVLSEWPLLLAAIGTVIVTALILLGPRLAAGSRVALAGLGLVVGGAVGNLLDRVRLGHVVDFIDFHFWPTFNVADAAITIGAILLILGFARPVAHGGP